MHAEGGRARVLGRFAGREDDTTSRFSRIARAALRALLAAFVLISGSANAAVDLSLIELPLGFHIEIFSDRVPNARAMTAGAFHDGKGIIYVGSMEAGNVYALEVDQSRVTRVHTIAHGLKLPVGVAWHDGQLFVSSVSRILRFDAIDTHLDAPPAPVVVSDRFPTETHHGWKFIAFGPDGKLYVPVGAPCNICEPDPNRYANIERMAADGSGLEVVARGVRNSVGFDWNPLDHSLWFTDNGRDSMGDDIPSDKLNHVTAADMNFGYPYCHQGDIADPEFGAKHACSEFTPPVAKLGPHVASLGMRFYRGTMFPPQYRNSIFIAEHGSWDRSHKIGYRVARVVVGPSGNLEKQEVFAQGWMQVERSGAERVYGRPVDVLELPDGSLLVSDDLAGAIYRIFYKQ